MKYFILVLTLIVFGCSAKTELPKGVLSQDEMVEVITEIELTQALIKLKFSNPDTLINRLELYDQVYMKFNISENQFNISLNHYCKEPMILQEIYVKIIQKLSENEHVFKK